MMILYRGPYLVISFEKENDLFVQFWSIPPKNIRHFKNEMIIYTNLYKEYKPSYTLWLQQNFTLQLNDEVNIWIEEIVNIPCFEYGNKKAAFVVGKDILAHLTVIDSFEKKKSVIKPVHFATEENARNWLKESINLVENDLKTEITFEGIDENGNLIIVVKKSQKSVANTIKLLRDIIEENKFIKNNIDKYSSLTKREREILKLRATGITYKDISKQIFLSPYTVQTHFRNIKKKLNINSFNDIIRFKKYFDL